MQRLKIDGRGYVLIPEQRYEALRRLAQLRGEHTTAGAAADLTALLQGAGFEREQAVRVVSAASFGLRLQRLRHARDLDQVELARLAGVSQTMVSNLENDKVERPSARAIHALLDALGIPAAAAYPLMGATPGSPALAEADAPAETAAAQAADHEPHRPPDPAKPSN
ncbi:MAG: helix-turn-helix transcriptional regulator [Acidobacteriota bacterium]|nr:helix-turn-helix transcriptional regulator [Acidobacteriota bacterium]